MAYDEDAPQAPVDPGVPQDGQLHPALEDFRQAFNTPEGRAWANDAVVAVQQHYNQVNVADANERVGQQFVLNLDATKNNLVGMVRNDPTAADLAMGLVPSMVDNIIHHNAGLPDDKVSEVAQSIRDHMQGSIAKAAVESLAERHAGAATDALSSKYADYFNADETAAMHGYIGAMDAARQADQVAQTRQLAEQRAQDNDVRAYQYAGGLLDPQTGGVQFPDGWAQRLMSDHTVPPEAKVGLFKAFNALQNGDVLASDPTTITDLAHRAIEGDMSLSDVYQHVGTNLRLKDAQMFSQAAINPKFKEWMGQLSITLDTARNYIAPDGDVAGMRAFGRFTNWVMDQAHRGESLDPRDDDYIFAGRDHPSTANPFARFLPRGDDIVVNAPKFSSSNTVDRPRLEDIFGTPRTNADRVVSPNRAPPVKLPSTDYGPDDGLTGVVHD